MDIKNKVALITGSSKRIGRAAALELARRGAAIAVHWRSDAALADETVASIRKLGVPAEAFHAELTDMHALEQMVAEVGRHFGGLDILVNSASVFDPGGADETAPADWDRQMDTNAKAPFFAAQAAARFMTARGAGKIVNIVDVAGEVIWPGYFAYSVSKAALIAVNRGLARACAPAVQVNAVAPGPVLFPEYYDAAQKQSAIARTLLKREGSPADVVNAIVFLIENDYITGEVIHVDGGRHLL